MLLLSSCCLLSALPNDNSHAAALVPAEEPEGPPPRMIIMKSCSMSSALVDLLGDILKGLGQPTVNDAPHGAGARLLRYGYEVLKPEKNIYGCKGKRPGGDELCEADLPIADAMDKLLTTARDHHRNSSLVFKGELNNWGLMGDAKLREVLQRHGTRYAMVLRDNELDRILCMVRDCFWDDLPAGMEQPRYARNVSEAECFRGRSKSFMKGEDRTTTPGAAGEDGSSSDGDGKDSKDAQKAATLDATTTPDTSQHELGQQRLHLVPDVLTKAIRMQVSKRAAEQRAVREVLWQRDDLAVLSSDDLFRFEQSLSEGDLASSVATWVKLLEALGTPPKKWHRKVIKNILGSSPARGRYPVQPHCHSVANHRDVKEALARADAYPEWHEHYAALWRDGTKGACEAFDRAEM